MKTLLLLLSLAAYGQQAPATPPPTPPVDVVIVIKADGVDTKLALSDEQIYTMNSYMHSAKLEGTFGDRLSIWLKQIAAELMQRPEFAPPTIKAIDDEIAAKTALKRAALIEASKEKKK